MRLALTLRYLVNGDTHANLQKISHIPRKCTMRIIPDMMEHIINIFYEDYLKVYYVYGTIYSDSMIYLIIN